MSDQFEAIRYRKNFLKEVIARVDFLSPLPGVDAVLPPALYKAAIGSFPIPESGEAVRREVSIGPDGAVTSTEHRTKEWRFHDRERTKTLTMGDEAVLVQHMNYLIFDPLKAELIAFLDKVRAGFPSVQLKRLGLRYVNIIELQEADPTDWSSSLDPRVLSLLNFLPAPERPFLSRALNQLEISYDEFDLRIVFGMHNPDYPARIRQKVFVLDLDAYTQSVTDVGRVESLLDNLHGKIQEYFERSVGDGLRSVMNGS